MDAFETAMRRAKCEKGSFVSFGTTEDAEREITLQPIRRFAPDSRRVARRESLAEHGVSAAAWRKAR